jgi:transcriptional regulator with XRE-family HTH domain
MNKCRKHEIGPPTIVPSYDASAMLGIEGVYLSSAVRETRCERCGYIDSVEIPNLEGLIATVAVTRVMLPLKLRGREIRFLRDALEMTAQELCEHALKVTPSQISKWENDKEPIGPHSETILRLYAVDHLAPSTTLHAEREAIYGMKLTPWHKLDEDLRMEFFLTSPDRTEEAADEPAWRKTA